MYMTINSYQPCQDYNGYAPDFLIIKHIKKLLVDIDCSWFLANLFKPWSIINRD